MDRTHSPINNLLEQAAYIARRSKKATGETEPTESYKRRQTEELIKFANDNGLWIDLSHLNITYMDKGGENEVFHDSNVSVVKLNNFEYARDDLENFFIRMTTHNKFWMDQRIFPVSNLSFYACNAAPLYSDGQVRYTSMADEVYLLRPLIDMLSLLPSSFH